MGGLWLPLQIAVEPQQKYTGIQKVIFIHNHVNHKIGLYSLGMGLTHCHVPGADKTEQRLRDNEVEMGMGIHGEPGREKIKFSTAKEHAVGIFSEYNHSYFYRIH